MAARFRFKLDALLRVRRLREREARRAVAAKRAEVARLDEERRRIRTDIDAALLRLRELAHVEAFDPPAVSRCRAWIAQRRAAAALLDEKRGVLLQELEQLQAVWRDARREQRVIEKLRDRRWQDYLRDRTSREQRDADELAQQLQIHRGREPEPGVFAVNDERAQT